MTERRASLVGSMLGATVGAAAGFLMYTERGRQLWEDFEPELGTLVQEAGRLTNALGQVRDGVNSLRSGSNDVWRRSA